MKKFSFFLLALIIGAAVFAGCRNEPEDPGEPPRQVIAPDDSTAQTSQTLGDENSGISENVVSVRIGRDGQTEWPVDMYNNAAAETMLGYLSGSALLFPTYTYDGEQGFVAQSIRGSYTRDDETEIADVKAGEIYLFSGGQLRLYFKDMDGANITATPVGCFRQTEGLTDAVTQAYESNLDDTWGVDVYFWITKNND